MIEYNVLNENYPVIIIDSYLKKISKLELDNNERKLYLRAISDFRKNLNFFEILKLVSELKTLDSCSYNTLESKKIISSFLVDLNDEIDIMDEDDLVNAINIIFNNINLLETEINDKNNDIIFTNNLLMNVKQNIIDNNYGIDYKKEYLKYIKKLRKIILNDTIKKDFYKSYLNKMFKIYNKSNKKINIKKK